MKTYMPGYQRHRDAYDLPIETLFRGAVILLGLFLVGFLIWRVLNSPADGQEDVSVSTNTPRSTPSDEPDWGSEDASTTKAIIPPNTIAGLLPDYWPEPDEVHRPRWRTTPR